MADDKKTLEMRVAELEDKLAQVHISEEDMATYHKVAAKLGTAAPCQTATPQSPCVAAHPNIVNQPIQACILQHCNVYNCIYRCIYQCIYQCIKPIINDCIGPNNCTIGGAGGGGFGGLGG